MKTCKYLLWQQAKIDLYDNKESCFRGKYSTTLSITFTLSYSNRTLLQAEMTCLRLKTTFEHIYILSLFLSFSLSIYLSQLKHTYICIYVYIHRERETDRQRERNRGRETDRQREREREKEGAREWELHPQVNTYPFDLFCLKKLIFF